MANSGSSNLTLGQQEIAQAAVVQNGYSVEYGRQAGIIETYTTKGGANRVPWTGAMGLQQRRHECKRLLQQSVRHSRSKAVSNQYAAQIGGPIKRDKYSSLRIRKASATSSPAPVLSICLPRQCKQHPANPNLSAGSKTLYGHVCRSECLSGIRERGSGRHRPGSQQDRLGELRLRKSCRNTGLCDRGTLGTSAAESCIDSAFVNAGALNREYLAAGSLDWNVSDRHRIFFRVTDDQGKQPTFVSLINPAWNQVSIQPN